MLNVILGNIFSLIANVFATLNGTRKKKRDMIICDMGAAFCFTISDLVLKGYSGAVQNIVGILRNIVALFMPDNKAIGWTLVAAGVIFGIMFNNKGILGLLPVVSCFYYSICVINKKTTARQLKFAFIINTISFSIYCFIIQNYVGSALDGFVAITAIYSYIKNPLPKE